MRIYWDSCLVIYDVERAPVFSDRLRAAEAGLSDEEVCISDLVRLECMVLPLRRKDEVLLRAYRKRLATWKSLQIDRSAFDLAAELRAELRLKTPDALHVACAIRGGCTQFWTNDHRLDSLATRIAVRIIG